MSEMELKQIFRKLNEIDSKVSALLVKEIKPSEEEKAAIKRGEKEFKEGKFLSWHELKAKMK
ncbi:MAG TPA: hypothetical protein VJK05_04765 [archaeon]|nr:hypothetical protein [archaeon]